MPDTKDEAPTVLAPPPPPWLPEDGRRATRRPPTAPAAASRRAETAPVPAPDPATRTWKGEGESRGRHVQRVVLYAAAASVLVLAVLLLLRWWDVGSHDGRVLDGVRVGPVDVGGMEEAEALAAVQEYANTVVTSPVPLSLDGGEAALDPREVGFTIAVADSVAAALDVGRAGNPISAFVDWMTGRDVPLQSSLQEETATEALLGLDFEGRQAPVEPQVSIEDDGDVVVADPVVGRQVVTEPAIARLDESLQRMPHPRVDLETADVHPRYTADDARAAVAAAEEMRHKTIQVEIAGIATGRITPLVVADMIHGIPGPDGYRVGIDDASLKKGLRAAMGSKAGNDAVEAKFDLTGEQIGYVEGHAGLGCCVEGSAALLEQALRNGDESVTLQPGESQPTLTVADLQKMGPIVKLAEFQTPHKCCEARVENIHKAADILRSQVIQPGEQWSMNEALGGQRRRSDGWVNAPSIADGVYTYSAGGGISQVATTLYNALYFAGIQVDEHKAHSHYIPRYPKGREATLGYPWPDLKFTNDMPHPVVIWTDYTGSSVTVSIWGTSDGRTVSEEGPDLGRYGGCQVVSRVRTVTWPDGREKSEKVRTIYDNGNPCVADEARSKSKGED